MAEQAGKIDHHLSDQPAGDGLKAGVGIRRVLGASVSNILIQQISMK